MLLSKFFKFLVFILLLELLFFDVFLILLFLVLDFVLLFFIFELYILLLLWEIVVIGFFFFWFYNFRWWRMIFLKGKCYEYNWWCGNGYFYYGYNDSCYWNFYYINLLNFVYFIFRRGLEKYGIGNYCKEKYV